jgi:hypothetical protein
MFLQKMKAWGLGLALATQTLTGFAHNPPDEGMWMPFLISQNFSEMQRLGLKITPEQIYSVNQSSLKDAIVHFGGFCTGEIISEQGLILTNHHCGYESIQQLSTTTKNYLQDGFWAKSLGEELPAQGLFVRFLVRMEDVTAQVNQIAGADILDPARGAKLKEAYESIARKATEGTHYTAKVEKMYSGGEHYLFVFETYNDVRLVGTPPESIGKFGGDTDNWMWPRHTGDFSLFRVYAGKDGKPAEYSKDNVPLKPRHSLPVSIKGIKADDFAMVFGYPGRTQRYLVSEDIRTINDNINPLIVNYREQILAKMKTFMDADPAIRLQYASTYAQIANYWKKWKGELKGFTRMNTIAVKQQLEAEFEKWAANSPDNKKYAGITTKLNAEVKGFRALAPWGRLLNDLIQSSTFMQLGFTAYQIEKGMTPPEGQKSVDKKVIEGMVANFKPQVEEAFKNGHPRVEQALLADLAAYMYKHLPKDQHPASLTEAHSKYKGDFAAFAAAVYPKSILGSKEKYEAFLKAPSAKILQKDPGYLFVVGIVNHYFSKIAPTAQAYSAKREMMYGVYIEGLRKMQPDKKFYPDANSTLRLTYGQVKAFDPADAVKYDFITYLEGIMEKKDNNNPEFVVPDKLTELYNKKDYGQYAQNGKLPVCFITNNDITGGNSGSPVIGGNGELIGLAFDGNWEAMTGDYVFEPPLQRTICVDTRYILFIIDKMAGATNLIQEMKLVR